MSIPRLIQMSAAGVPAGGGGLWTEPDLANAFYDSKSFATTTQETFPFDLDFKPDGTAFIIVGQTTDTAYQYDCSTAWDISTASYANKSLNLSSQVSSPRGVQFNYDGTKMYVHGQINDAIYEYVLSTAYDVSTGSYNNVSLDLTTAVSAGTNFSGSQFYIPSGGSQDGTKLYVGCFNTDKIYSWTLSTAWDLSTASLDSNYFAVVSFDAVHNGMYVNPDGTKWWFGARQSDKIYQFSMSTPYDISTSSKDTAELSWASQTTDIAGFKFKTDGSKLYAMSSGTDTILQYSTVTPAPWTNPDITNASYDSVSFSVATQQINSRGVTFKSDGTKLYVVGSNTNIVYAYDLITPWDITTATYNSENGSVNSQETNAADLIFKPDGTKMYALGSTNDTVYQYSLSTAWDVSTLSYDNKSISVASQDATPTGIILKSDGTSFYMCGSANDNIYQYDMTTAYDISTASYANKSVSVSTNPLGLFLNPDDDQIYYCDSTSDLVYAYDLTTAGDLSTAVNTNTSFSTGTQMTACQGVTFKSDGSKAYVIDYHSNTIYQYST